MPSNGYGTAVGTSAKLNLGWDSTANWWGSECPCWWDVWQCQGCLTTHQSDSRTHPDRCRSWVEWEAWIHMRWIHIMQIQTHYRQWRILWLKKMRSIVSQILQFSFIVVEQYQIWSIISKFEIRVQLRVVSMYSYFSAFPAGEPWLRALTAAACFL